MQPKAGAKPDSQELMKRLKSVIDYVRDCERRVTQGDIMDLKGLDDNVVELCDGVAALPPKEGKELEDQMAALIKDLENLASAMKAQQAKFEAEGK